MKLINIGKLFGVDVYLSYSTDSWIACKRADGIICDVIRKYEIKGIDDSSVVEDFDRIIENFRSELNDIADKISVK